MPSCRTLSVVPCRSWGKERQTSLRRTCAKTLDTDGSAGRVLTMFFHLFLIFFSFPVRNVNKISKAPETISKIMKRLQTAKTSGEEIWKRYVIPFTSRVSIPVLTSGLYIGFMGINFDAV